MSPQHDDSSQGRSPTPDELDRMSREELARLGNRLDDVQVVHLADQWPVPGTREERRAERGLAAWFMLAGLAGLAFFVVFAFWPWEYKTPDDENYLVFQLYTPLLGLTLGLCVLALGIGVIGYAKKFLPDEVSVQTRHDGPSDDTDRRTIAAMAAEAGATSGLSRRKLIVRSAGFAGGAMSLGLGAVALGGFLQNPWRDGNDSDLMVTGWRSVSGEKVYLRRDTGDPHEVRLVRPEDMDAGAMETVFPFRWSEEEDPEALVHGLRRADSPVMLIRLRPGTEVVQRKGQEGFNFGDYWAYSKICTHVGCPTSLYEQQSNRILCPCHQSQFDITQYAKPIFGPATRALPQLPIDVDDEGYFYATGDFIEPIGPAYWERKP